MLQFSTQNKLRINLCCNCPDKTKFGSTYVTIFHTKQNSDQPMFDFFLQKNKVRIELYCNCPDKTKSESTYVAIFHTQKKIQNKIRINLCCNFPHTQKNSKQNSDQHMLQFSTHKKKFKTKFGSAHVAIFHTKQTSDQPTLQLS